MSWVTWRAEIDDENLVVGGIDGFHDKQVANRRACRNRMRSGAHSANQHRN